MDGSLQVPIEPVRGYLHTPFASRLAGKVDVLVFNPPYVPTEEEEGISAQASADIAAAWAGGAAGLSTADLLIHAAPVCLFSVTKVRKALT
jgi:release factor glutamine methyltransferase